MSAQRCVSPVKGGDRARATGLPSFQATMQPACRARSKQRNGPEDGEWYSAAGCPARGDVQDVRILAAIRRLGARSAPSCDALSAAMRADIPRVPRQDRLCLWLPCWRCAATVGYRSAASRPPHVALLLCRSRPRLFYLRYIRYTACAVCDYCSGALLRGGEMYYTDAQKLVVYGCEKKKKKREREHS